MLCMPWQADTTVVHPRAIAAARAAVKRGRRAGVLSPAPQLRQGPEAGDAGYVRGYYYEPVQPSGVRRRAEARCTPTGDTKLVYCKYKRPGKTR